MQKQEVAKDDSLGPDESNIAEVLNVAWAMHEITADFMSETLDFFDARGDAKTLDLLYDKEGSHPLTQRLHDRAFD